MAPRKMKPALTVADLPDHDFKHDGNGDPEHPDAVCLAPLVTATLEEDGYGFITQCGHAWQDHPGYVPPPAPPSEDIPPEDTTAPPSVIPPTTPPATAPKG